MDIIKNLPESWNSDGMNWEDPDPYNPVYYLAILGAYHERTCFLYDLKYINGDAYNHHTREARKYLEWLERAYAYFNTCNFLNFDNTQYNPLFFIDKLFELLPSFLDKDAFFNNKQVTTTIIRWSSICDNYPYPDVSSIRNDAMKKYLICARDYLNNCTLYRGPNMFYGRIEYGGSAEVGYAEPQSGSTYPGTPPPYDYMPFGTLYSEAVSKLNEEYTASLNSAKTWLNSDAAATFTDWLDHIPDSLTFEYYLRRENNYPYGHSYMSLNRRSVLLFARDGSPFAPNVHCIITNEDDSYSEVTDTGVTQTYVDTGIGIAPGYGTYLMPNFKTSFKDTYYLIESKDIESFPIQDVEVPLAGTKGWQYYQCGGQEYAHFVLDFNCEGGFKFRPDA